MRAGPNRDDNQVGYLNDLLNVIHRGRSVDHDNSDAMCPQLLKLLFQNRQFHSDEYWRLAWPIIPPSRQATLGVCVDEGHRPRPLLLRFHRKMANQSCLAHAALPGRECYHAHKATSLRTSVRPPITQQPTAKAL